MSQTVINVCSSSSNFCTVIKSLSKTTPEKFLENESKQLILQSQGCLYQYIKSKKFLDSSIAFYPHPITKINPTKPVLPINAPIAVVLFAGGGGIEAGMIQAGIRPVVVHQGKFAG